MASTPENHPVSGRCLRDLLAAALRRGIDPAPLLQGLSFSAADLQLRSSAVEWNEFMLFTDRLLLAAGGDAPFMDLAADLTVRLRPLELFATLFVDPQDIFRVMAPKVARNLYPGLLVSCDGTAGEALVFECLHPSGFTASRAFFLATLSMLRAYPRLIGLPDAHVDADFVPPLFRYGIYPPASRPLPARARAVAAPVASLLRRHLSPDSGGDLLDDLDAAEDCSRVMDQVYETGRAFSSFGSLDELADAVLDWLTVTFECPYASISLDAGQQRLDRSRGRPAAAQFFARVMTMAGHEVGRLSWSLSQEAPLAVCTIDAIVPWIALGVEGCSRSSYRDRLDHHLDGARSRWRLTTRQVRVLELIARGCANKEIASAMACSTKGVESHVTMLLRKSGADSRTALVARLWDG